MSRLLCLPRSSRADAGPPKGRNGPANSPAATFSRRVRLSSRKRTRTSGRTRSAASTRLPRPSSVGTACARLRPAPIPHSRTPTAPRTPISRCERSDPVIGGSPFAVAPWPLSCRSGQTAAGAASRPNPRRLPRALVGVPSERHFSATSPRPCSALTMTPSATPYTMGKGTGFQGLGPGHRSPSVESDARLLAERHGTTTDRGCRDVRRRRRTYCSGRRTPLRSSGSVPTGPIASQEVTGAGWS
jgi:hypothetical protein